MQALADFGVPKYLVVPLSFALPVVELVIACLLLPSASAWWGALAAMALLLIFDAAIAANLAVGNRPKCNCFGQLHSKPIGWETFARNLAIAGVACLLVWQGRVQPSLSLWQFYRRVTPEEAAIIAVAIFACAGFVVGGFLALHLFRQNGRVLLRIESLEANRALAQQQQPVRPVPQGLPIGTKAIPFDLPKVNGGRGTLEGFLRDGKPLLLISTDPNCGPCNALMTDIALWQKSLSAELNVVLLSHGRHADNRDKAAEHGLVNVLLEKDHKIAEKYHALGTPTGVLVRSDGTIGSPAMGGADGIRQLVTNKVWTDGGFAALMKTFAQPPQAAPPKVSLPVGSPAPPFALPDLSGNTVDSAHFNGNGTMLVFWNPACGFCQRMLPQLKDWEKAKSEKAPRVVLISNGSHEANRAMGLSSTVLIDDKFAVGQRYGASGTPSGLLIDADGKVATGLAVGEPSIMGILTGSCNFNLSRLRHLSAVQYEGWEMRSRL
jgi:peroxiredoxin